MTPDEKYAYARSFPVVVGVDTAKKFHVLVARGPDFRRRKPQRVDVSRAGFETADLYLRRTFPDVPREQVLVGFEFAGHHGHTFAGFLAQRGYPIVSVLAAMTKKHKEDEDNSPLKSDAKDAGVICRLTGEGKFVTFTALQSPFTELRVLAMQRHRLSIEQVRFKNQLRGVLDLVWPEFLECFASISLPTPREVLRRWPLPADLAAASSRVLQSVVQKTSRNHYPRQKIEALLEGARTSVGLSHAPEERRREIRDLLERWDLVQRQLSEAEECIEALVAQYPPARALTTIPELGPVGAATILSEMGTLSDYVHPRQVLKLAGMNLVYGDTAERRGRRRQSKRGRPLLRRQIFLLATRWCMKRGLFYEQYQAMQQRNGGSKIKAICALARKLVPLLLEIAQTGQPFDPERWQAERRIRSAVAVRATSS
jgi:transposase